MLNATTSLPELRIVPKAIAVEPLSLKSGIAAPRSPVNNCGTLTGGGDPVMIPTPSEHASAVLNLVDNGVIGWDDPEVVTVLRCALKHDALRLKHQQRSGEPLKPDHIAPSARLTRCEWKRIPYIKAKLLISGIFLGGAELKALARGVIYTIGGKTFSFEVLKDWEEWSKLDA